MANFTSLAAARYALLAREGWNVVEDGLFNALRLPDGSPCGDRCRSIFTIGGLCCDGAGFMPS
jgi:hypothetical protein